MTRNTHMLNRDDTIAQASVTTHLVAPEINHVGSSSVASVPRHPFRRLWLSVHLYLGLFGGGLFVLMSLTGSFLVFYKTIDEWLNPAQVTTSGEGPFRPLSEIVSAAQSAGPAGSVLDGIEWPSHRHGVFIAWHKVPTGTPDRFRWYQVTIDPYTGAILSRDREWGGYLVSFIYELHQSLLLDDPGETIVGFVAIFLLVLVGTGVFLWWPRSGRVRQGFLPAAGVSRLRRQYQWHRLTGAYSAIVLAVLAFTGVYLAFPTYVTPLVSVFSPVDEASDERSVQSRQISGAPSLSVEQVVGLVQSLFPDGRITYIGIPHEATDAYDMTVHLPGDVREATGNSRVWLDQYSGAVLKVRDWRSFTAGETFVAWLFPLHNGEAFGLTGRWIVFFAGWIPLVLYGTALRMWWLKRQAHQRQKRHAGGGV